MAGSKGEEHGKVSDLDLDISRSGSDRSSSPPEAEEFNFDQTNTEDLFLHCRSIEDIEIKELKYVGDFMKCFVCDAKFSYRSDQPRDFVEWDSK